MSLISCILPSLRRRISCCKSFSIFAIRVIESSSCLSRLWPDTTSCSTRGTSFLCLEATLFSLTSSEATGGTLVALLFLGHKPMLYEKIASSLSFSQSLVKSPNVWVPFFLAPRPKDPGPNTCGLVDWAWFTVTKWVVYKTKWCIRKGSYNEYVLASKNIYIYIYIYIEQQKENNVTKKEMHNNC